jgi:hypothetical protein
MSENRFALGCVALQLLLLPVSAAIAAGRPSIVKVSLQESRPEAVVCLYGTDISKGTELFQRRGFDEVHYGAKLENCGRDSYGTKWCGRFKDMYGERLSSRGASFNHALRPGLYLMLPGGTTSAVYYPNFILRNSWRRVSNSRRSACPVDSGQEGTAREQPSDCGGVCTGQLLAIELFQVFDGIKREERKAYWAPHISPYISKLNKGEPVNCGFYNQMIKNLCNEGSSHGRCK